MGKSKKRDEAFVFRAHHFYTLLERQEYRCALTGRELTPENTNAEHIVPLRSGGKHEFENIYLVDERAARIKRYMTEDEVIRLAADIIATRGHEYGLKLVVGRKKG